MFLVPGDATATATAPAVEPLVPAARLLAAIPADQVESFRPLLPVGYAAGAEAYRQAVAGLTAHDLTTHYTSGLDWFHHEFIPSLKGTLAGLVGGVWDLADFVAFAAGSDVDFMTHLVEAVAAREDVCVYPGDWFGFRVGCTHPERIHWSTQSRDRLACLCVPSVRNGQLTEEMGAFLDESAACLLNLNLLPTLPAGERRAVAERLRGVLGKAVLSISFSRGFGLTASQLGVALVHRDHPYCRRFAKPWHWFTYFHNALAARAFLALDLRRLQEVDAARRQWVHDCLRGRNLPVVATGSYYVKSFRVDGEIPERLRPLSRDDVVRLCFKPPQA
jgi:hypothetical protein